MDELEDKLLEIFPTNDRNGGGVLPYLVDVPNASTPDFTSVFPAAEDFQPQNIKILPISPIVSNASAWIPLMDQLVNIFQ